MRKTVFLTALLFLLIPFISESFGGELVVTCKKDGSELYRFSFRKALDHKEFCGPIDEPRANYSMASKIVQVEGVYKVVSIEEYDITIIKGTNFSVEEIGENLKPIIGKYLRVNAKDVIIIYE